MIRINPRMSDRFVHVIEMTQLNQASTLLSMEIGISVDVHCVVLSVIWLTRKKVFNYEVLSNEHTLRLLYFEIIVLRDYCTVLWDGMG